MVRASIFAGAVLRPNNSFAGVAGSSGWASGGSGSGLRLPRSWAAAFCGIHNSAAHSNGAARRAAMRQAAPNGVFIVVVMLAASEMRIGPPPPERRPARVGTEPRLHAA